MKNKNDENFKKRLLSFGRKGFKYYYNNDNFEIVVEGSVSYKYLKECYFIKIENTSFDTSEYYVTVRKPINFYGLTWGYTYIDLLTNKVVFERKAETYDRYVDNPYKAKHDPYLSNVYRKFISELKLEEYLYGFNFIKEYYTIDDVKKIFIEMEKIEKNKIMIKK